MLRNLLDEIGNQLPVLISPGLFFSPVIPEVLLDLPHLFCGSLLCIFLQTGIQCGIDCQPTGIEIVTVVFTPILQICGNIFAEIESLTVIVVLYLYIKT